MGCLTFFVSVHILFFLSATYASQDCMFPREMYGTIRDWRIQSRDPEVPVTHIMRQVQFEVTDAFVMKYMDQYGENGIVDIETYDCVQSLRNKTYILKRERDGNSSYVCMQFIVRNKNVIQWRKSHGSQNKDINLCQDDQLILMDSPLLYYRSSGFWREERNRDMEYNHCPLEGGYVLQWRHPVSGEMLCDMDVPPLKLESECEHGEGMRFHVAHSHDNCQGSDYEIINAPYNCLANWEYGGHLYTVLVRPQDDLRYLLCMRVPVVRGDKFQGHIFLDTVCDSTRDLSHTTDYRELTFRRYNVANLCEDEAPACERYEGSDCDFPEAEVCRRSCRVCEPGDIGRPEVEFPKSFHGDWLKHTRRIGQEIVTIQRRSFTIPSMSTYTILSECNTQRRISSSHRGNSFEYIMLSTYTNGCSPRVNTLIIAERDESVLSFRLGPSQLATLSIDVNDVDFSWRVNNDLWGYKCESMNYLSDPDPLYDTYRPYQDGWFNLVNADQNAPTVECEVPFNSTLRDITLKTNSGVSCKGRLKDVFPSSVRLDVDSCTYTMMVDTATEFVSLAGQSYTFSCLTRFQSDQTMAAPNERIYLITRALHGVSPTGHAHQCWVFLPERQTVYWTPTSECDANTEHHVDAGFKQPAAYLTFYQNAANLPSGNFASIVVVSYSLIHLISP